MAILDLQGMEIPDSERERGGKSHGSKSCGGGGISGLSVALC
jgi:hypothetical protein